MNLRLLRLLILWLIKLSRKHRWIIILKIINWSKNCLRVLLNLERLNFLVILCLNNLTILIYSRKGFFRKILRILINHVNWRILKLAITLVRCYIRILLVIKRFIIFRISYGIWIILLLTQNITTNNLLNRLLKLLYLEHLSWFQNILLSWLNLLNKLRMLILL